MNCRVLAKQRPSNSKSVRVLMADPDLSLGPAYRRPLLEHGFVTTMVCSGLECVTQLRERTPDLLVLEPQLPWGGGEGVLAIMGEIPRLANVPVMVLTACRDPRLLEAVARFPISDYQLKPLSPERLAGRLHAILARPKSRFTLAEQIGRLESAIAARTGGLVQNLRVEAVDGRIIVHGRTETPHVKDVVLNAVLEAFEASQAQSERVELDIEVASEENWQARRCSLSGMKNWNKSDEFDLTKES